MIAIWTTGYGSQASSHVLAEFEDDGVRYVVVRCGRGRYDAAEPFAVMKADDCILATVR